MEDKEFWDEEFWDEICRSLIPSDALLEYVHDNNLHKDEEKIKELLLGTPIFAYRSVNGILGLYPRYCMYLPLRYWVFNVYNSCIAHIKREDVDTDRVLEIMWYTHNEDLAGISSTSYNLLGLHPWLVSVIPLESFPFRGYAWYACPGEIFDWMPPNIKEIIEEQEIERRLYGGSPCRKPAEDK